MLEILIDQINQETQKYFRIYYAIKFKLSFQIIWHTRLPENSSLKHHTMLKNKTQLFNTHIWAF